MYRLLFVSVFLTGVFLSHPAQACLCAWQTSISDLEGTGATTILASPVGGFMRSSARFNGETHSKDVPTRFKIWKTYTGQADGYEDIEMSSSPTCTTTYPVHKMSVIVAYREKGQLNSTYCSAHQFTRKQLIDYFEYGIDTPGRDACYTQIFTAYENEKNTGEFRLEDTKCSVHKATYDSKYLRKGK